MPTLTKVPAGAVTMYDVSWDFYEQFLDEFHDRYIRHTYDDGVLEIMSPIGWQHESPKRLITWLIQVYVEEWKIPILCLGSMTLRSRRKAKGIEPDECFYITREAEMRSRADYDPDRDPPPDLAIEIDWTHASVPRMPVYAKLGVPEVWRYADDQLTVYRLSETDEYEEAGSSLAFPTLPLDEFKRFTKRDPSIDETTWILQFRDWVRTTIAQS